MMNLITNESELARSLESAGIDYIVDINQDQMAGLDSWIGDQDRRIVELYETQKLH